ncbi:hypothetical protein [Planobispora longispora]|uniref:hypothetical protein n=1 Tax=Planobispora longispora TaxID=28887 RepID=UPI001941E04B|nr:hypothetical protein [Planobispora longispora]
MDELEPLPGDLLPEVRELAEFLRERFAEIKRPLKPYAHGRGWGPDTVSRYLNGKSVPTWDFLRPFLHDAALRRGRPMSADQMERARELQKEALRVSNELGYELEELRSRLDEAKVEKEEAERRLRHALARHQQQIDAVNRVEVKRRALESRWRQRELTASSGEEAKQYTRDHELLLQRQQALEAEVERLEAERETAELEKEKADRKCLALEAALSKYKAVEVEIGDLGSQEKTVVPTAVPAAVYIFPIYLGFIYRLFSGSSLFLKICTLAGLMIPVWVSYGIKRLERSRLAPAVRLAYAAATTLIIFIVSTALPLERWIW